MGVVVVVVEEWNSMLEGRLVHSLAECTVEHILALVVGVGSMVVVELAAASNLALDGNSLECMQVHML